MNGLQRSLGQQLAIDLKRLRRSVAELDGRTDQQAQETRDAAVAEMREHLEKVFSDESLLVRIRCAIDHFGLCRGGVIPTSQELADPDVLIRVGAIDIAYIVDTFAEPQEEPYAEHAQWTLWRLVRIARQAKRGL